MITLDQLTHIFPVTPQDILKLYAPVFSDAMAKYHIDTLERMRCFIAQVGEETNGLKSMKEYASGAEYEGRHDLGNVLHGDGVKFKGRSGLMVTGRSNYAACSKYLFGDERLLDHPELLEQPQYAVEGACWYWNSRNLSAVADHDDAWTFTAHHPQGTWNKFQWLTILINGGLNGYEDRLHYYERAKSIIL